MYSFAPDFSKELRQDQMLALDALGRLEPNRIRMMVPAGCPQIVVKAGRIGAVDQQLKYSGIADDC